MIDPDLVKRCQELIQWNKTGLLKGEAVRSYAEWLKTEKGIPETHAMRVAENMIKDAAMEAIAALAAGKPDEVSFPRWWIEQVKDGLVELGNIPGAVGDYIFMLREQLKDKLAEPVISKKVEPTVSKKPDRDLVTPVPPLNDSLGTTYKREDGTMFYTPDEP